MLKGSGLLDDRRHCWYYALFLQTLYALSRFYWSLLYARLSTQIHLWSIILMLSQHFKALSSHFHHHYFRTALVINLHICWWETGMVQACHQVPLHFHWLLWSIVELYQEIESPSNLPQQWAHWHFSKKSWCKWLSSTVTRVLTRMCPKAKP